MTEDIAPSIVCPLCRSEHLVETDSKKGEEIEGSWHELGIQIPREHWGGLRPETRVVLYRCAHCAFEFFDSRLAGGGGFYEALEHPDYYCANRPEFSRTCTMASSRGLRRVLDVGCGDGSFLDLARKNGMETQGIELNNAAAERARNNGHTVHQKLLHEFDNKEADGTFDLITMFQVLEHVTDPAGVMSDARRLLSKSGMISVSVPSSSGILRFCPDDPHQWPPHHVSRWTCSDLKQLGRASGLVLEEAGGDHLFASDVKFFLHLQMKLARRFKGRREWLSPIRIHAYSQLYRLLGLKRVFRNRGVSVYGYYRHA